MRIRFGVWARARFETVGVDRLRGHVRRAPAGSRRRRRAPGAAVTSRCAPDSGHPGDRARRIPAASRSPVGRRRRDRGLRRRSLPRRPSPLREPRPGPASTAASSRESPGASPRAASSAPGRRRPASPRERAAASSSEPTRRCGASNQTRVSLRDREGPRARRRRSPGAGRKEPDEEVGNGREPGHGERRRRTRRARGRPGPESRPPLAAATRCSPGSDRKACRRRSRARPSRRAASRRRRSATRDFSRGAGQEIRERRRSNRAASFAVTRVSSQRITSASSSTRRARGERSSRFPIGVPTTTSCPEARGLEPSRGKIARRDSLRYDPPVRLGPSALLLLLRRPRRLPTGASSSIALRRRVNDTAIPESEVRRAMLALRPSTGAGRDRRGVPDAYPERAHRPAPAVRRRSALRPGASRRRGGLGRARTPPRAAAGRGKGPAVGVRRRRA